MRQLITPKSVIAATVVASFVVAGAIGAVGYQSYANAQSEARAELQQANASVSGALEDYASRVEVLKKELATANATLTGSAGKTLDETARTQLQKTIASSADDLKRAEREAERLTARAQAINASFEEQLLWPPSALELAETLSAATDTVSGNVVRATDRVVEDTKAVVVAQAAWQAEQDRIAAEAAAEAEAKARQAVREVAREAVNNIKQSGPPSAPSVQPAPLPNAASTFNAVTFLRQLVSENEARISVGPISWCKPNYLCGQASFWQELPEITILGSNGIPANYDSPGGRYVLVHEAAHVRQYYYQGDFLSMLSLAPPVPEGWEATRPASHWPVEFMADCSTEFKTGFVGTYTSGWAGLPSCTPQQRDAASLIW